MSVRQPIPTSLHCKSRLHAVLRAGQATGAVVSEAEAERVAPRSLLLNELTTETAEQDIYAFSVSEVRKLVPFLAKDMSTLVDSGYLSNVIVQEIIDVTIPSVGIVSATIKISMVALEQFKIVIECKLVRCIKFGGNCPETTEVRAEFAADFRAYQTVMMDYLRALRGLPRAEQVRLMETDPRFAPFRDAEVSRTCTVAECRGPEASPRDPYGFLTIWTYLMVETLRVLDGDLNDYNKQNRFLFKTGLLYNQLQMNLYHTIAQMVFAPHQVGYYLAQREFADTVHSHVSTV